jgi:hypothetical protein
MLDSVIFSILFVLTFWRSTLNVRDYNMSIHYKDMFTQRIALDAAIYSLLTCSMFLYFLIDSVIY